MMDLTAAERQAMGGNARRYYEAYYSGAQVYGDLESWLYEAAALRR